MKERPLVKKNTYVWIYLWGKGWTKLEIFKALDLMYEEGYKAGRKAK